jgi:hypothetical protein
VLTRASMPGGCRAGGGAARRMVSVSASVACASMHGAPI